MSAVQFHAFFYEHILFETGKTKTYFNMKNIKVLLLLLVTVGCNQKNHIEKEIIKYYSENVRLHDPSSFEIASVDLVKKIYTIDEIKGNLKQKEEKLQMFSRNLKRNPKDEFYKKYVKQFTSDIYGYNKKIDSIERGLIDNRIEHFEVYFSYRAKNTYGALILSDAMSKMMYSEYSSHKEKYGTLYSVEKLD